MFCNKCEITFFCFHPLDIKIQMDFFDANNDRDVVYVDTARTEAWTDTHAEQLYFLPAKCIPFGFTGTYIDRRDEHCRYVFFNTSLFRRTVTDEKTNDAIAVAKENSQIACGLYHEMLDRRLLTYPSGRDRQDELDASWINFERPSGCVCPPGYTVIDCVKCNQ
jgi:hypothetical protein